LCCVSVVIIARAASIPPSADRSVIACFTPLLSAGIFSGSPIRPVEHTKTSPAPTSIVPVLVSSADTNSAVACVSKNPCGPVQALAPPELSTTIRPSLPSNICLDQITGAAANLFVVKTAAARACGPIFTTRATSFALVDLSPAATPAARNP